MFVPPARGSNNNLIHLFRGFFKEKPFLPTRKILAWLNRHPPGRNIYHMIKQNLPASNPGVFS